MGNWQFVLCLQYLLATTVFILATAVFILVNTCCCGCLACWSNFGQTSIGHYVNFVLLCNTLYDTALASLAAGALNVTTYTPSIGPDKEQISARDIGQRYWPELARYRPELAR